MTTMSPNSELQVVADNDPKNRLHVKSECQFVTEATSKCNMVN